MQNYKKKLLPALAFVVLLVLSLFAYLHNPPKIINLNTYNNFLKNDQFKKAYIKDNEVVLLTEDASYSIIKDGIDLEKLLNKVPVEIKTDENSSEILSLILFLFVILVAFIFGKKVENIKQNKSQKNESKVYQNEAVDLSQRFQPSKSTLRFKDVAGIVGVKEELEEIVDYLKNSKKYQDFGIKLPRGVLLIGPPGVGKTMIAKAVAGEANVPFFYQSGASFVHIYVGMGPKRVRELFENAKKYSPSIIFIDEIDAVGKARGGGRNDERESTLNQLLTEMDGFEDNSNIMVIAATNKIEMLDEALLRSGRFDRRVFVSLPDLSDRKEIIDIYLKDKNHDVSSKSIAKMSVGFSGAALATFVNEAAINALKRDSMLLEELDFLEVKDKVILGKKKIMSYSDDEKKIQATYQVAKALSAYWYEIDFDKVTMVDSFIKDREREIESKTQMFAKLKVYLSGFVASELFFNETYTNAQQDIQRAKSIAEAMVKEYAMGDGVVPTAIDNANLIDSAIEDVEEFLSKTKEAIEILQVLLLKKESISYDELKSVVSDFL